jgi:predicted PurR-regulated permease PerM
MMVDYISRAILKSINHLRPLRPSLIIFAVFFWGVALGGILGMMLAIPLTAFAVVFWRLLKKKYITEVV